ncbi:phage capsid protein [uncultured Clostridium sp.]
MLNKGTIREALKVDVAVSEQMANAIELWSMIYENKAPWLNNNVKSLNLGATISAEVARMVTIEFKSEITKNNYLNDQYQRVLKDLRRYVEYGCSKGGLVFKPYIDGKEIAVDYVQADKFYPIKYNSKGEVTAAVFLEQKIDGKKTYTRLEYHELTDEGYIINNTAYVNEIALMGNNGNRHLGKPVSLTEVDEWRSLEESTIIKYVIKPLFAYFKIPFANTIDFGSPLGTSIYSRSIDLIKQADEQWGRILWEYEGSELSIDVDVTAFRKDEKGNLNIPRGKERLYRSIDLDDNNSKWNIFSPVIRDSAYFNGLNNILKRIEFNCGLSYGTISDPQEVDKTATEIVSSKQRMYSTVKDIQGALESALNDLIYAMDVWAKLAGLSIEEYGVSYNWDDSIVVDKDSELISMQSDVAAGIIRPELYIMKKYGVTEEEAIKMMPKVDNTLTKSPFDEE